MKKKDGSAPRRMRGYLSSPCPSRLGGEIFPKLYLLFLLFSVFAAFLPASSARRSKTFLASRYSSAVTRDATSFNVVHICSTAALMSR